MLDLTKPINYYLFPYNLQKDKKIIRLSVTERDINILRKETNIKFIKNDIPDQYPHTIVIYQDNIGCAKELVKELLSNYNLHEQNLITLTQIYQAEIKKRGIEAKTATSLLPYCDCEAKIPSEIKDKTL